MLLFLWAFAIKVFGWCEDLLIGEERESSYFVPVGYLKGAQEAAEDLTFDIRVPNGNLGKQTSSSRIEASGHQCTRYKLQSSKEKY